MERLQFFPIVIFVMTRCKESTFTGHRQVRHAASDVFKSAECRGALSLCLCGNWVMTLDLLPKEKRVGLGEDVNILSLLSSMMAQW